MNLEKCTKEELIFIINHLKQFSFLNIDYHLERAFNDLKYNRELEKIKEAKKWAKHAADTRNKYFEYVKKYEGTPIVKIPRNDLFEMERLLKEAEKADKKWAALSGVDL